MKQIIITSCPQCPHHTVGREHVGDPADDVRYWWCKLLGKYIRRYVEKKDKSDVILANCPLEDAQETL